MVVIKKLLQTHPNAHTDIIKHMSRLVDNITVPQARASILWLLGEYSHLVPKLAPDVLRKTAKTFVNEVLPYYKINFSTYDIPQFQKLLIFVVVFLFSFFFLGGHRQTANIKSSSQIILNQRSSN